MADLHRAVKAFEANDLAACRRELAAVWKQTRHPRLGPLVAALDGKTSALVAELGGLSSRVAAERVAALAPWDAPAIEEALFRVLEAPPWRALSAAPFFSQAVKALSHSEGARLLALGERYSDVIPTSAGHRYGKLMVRAGKAARKKQWPELASEPLDALEKALVGKAVPKSRTLEQLYAAVYAAPTDDGPRRVLADALLEAGDPRGELIALQLSGGDPERVEALLKKHGEKWLGPLAKGVNPEFVRWRAGFPEAVGLFRSLALLPKAVGHAEWATVRHAHLAVDRWTQAKARAQLVELLTSPHCRALESVRWLRPDVMVEVAARKPRWRHVGVSLNAYGIDGLLEGLELPDCLADFPALHTLDVELGDSEANLKWVFDPKVAARVSRLRFVSPGDAAQRLWKWAAAAGFAELELAVGYEPREPEVHSAGERLVFRRGKSGELDQLTVTERPVNEYFESAARSLAAFRAAWQAGRRSATN